jgi:hypothetical protein
MRLPLINRRANIPAESTYRDRPIPPVTEDTAMSRDARKKQKQRLKREQKRRDARRARAVTPLEHVARSGGQLECYVNANWREMGMANIQVLGRAPDGRTAYTAFLVDVWCVGLKDAFGKREMSRPDFEVILDQMDNQFEVAKLPAAEAKRLVAGGMRFARQNGFKLPPHYERWVAVFGDLDVAGADLRNFGVEGGLRYIGTRAFLQRRLAACSADDFLRRPDVQWAMGDGTPRDPSEGDYSIDLGDDDYEENDEDEDEEADVEAPDPQLVAELGGIVGSTGNRMEEAVREWCAKTGQAPHPQLRDALNHLLVSMLPVVIYSDAAKIDPQFVDVELPAPDHLLHRGLESLPPGQRRSVEQAMTQVSDYMGQFKSPAEMLAAVGAMGHGPDAPLPPA